MKNKKQAAGLFVFSGPSRRVILLGPRIRKEFQTPSERIWTRRKLKELGLSDSERGSNQDRLLSVDGGTIAALEQGLTPDFAIGDWDSLSAVERRRVERLGIPRLTLEREKDRSDFDHALRVALDLDPIEIIALGFTGGRPDHHLSGLLDLAGLVGGKPHAAGLRRLKSVSSLGPDGSYYFLSDRLPYWKRRMARGTIVSLFAMNGPVLGLELKGFKYTFKNTGEAAALRPSSQGLSNLTRSSEPEVRIRRGQLLIVVPCG